MNASCETQFSYGKPDAGNLHVRFDEGDARASGHLYSTVLLFKLFSGLPCVCPGQLRCCPGTGDAVQ